jgi:hypothetical protein
VILRTERITSGKNDSRMIIASTVAIITFILIMQVTATIITVIIIIIQIIIILIITATITPPTTTSTTAAAKLLPTSDRAVGPTVKVDSPRTAMLSPTAAAAPIEGNILPLPLIIIPLPLRVRAGMEEAHISSPVVTNNQVPPLRIIPPP